MSDHLTNLKPCPFCGGDVHFSSGDDCHIICLNPGCNVLDMVFKASFNNFEELVKQWNTRANPSEYTGLMVNKDKP